jgi:hypothetical protein
LKGKRIFQSILIKENKKETPALKVFVLCGGHQDKKESVAQLEPIPKVYFFYYKNITCFIQNKNKTLIFKIYF